MLIKTNNISRNELASYISANVMVDNIHFPRLYEIFKNLENEFEFKYKILPLHTASSQQARNVFYNKLKKQINNVNKN